MRKIRKTLLLVGEGKTEKAFLEHLCSLYCADRQGVAVTIRNAYGGGPENVVDRAIRYSGNFSYDRVAVLMDTDRPWDDETRKRAKKNNITLIGSEPCIEGMLLGILEQAVPEGTSSKACKGIIQKKLPNRDLTEKESYQPCFSRSTLESARSKIPALNRLLECLEGS
jgi:hypothetical protein